MHIRFTPTEGSVLPNQWGKTDQWSKILLLHFQKNFMILVYLTKCVCVVITKYSSSI